MLHFCCKQNKRIPGAEYSCDAASLVDPKGYVLGTWIIYIACGGQREAAPLGYSPIPPNLIAADFAAVRRIPGAPTPPPIDSQHCPNPTVRTLSASGGTTTQGSGSTSQAASASSSSAGAATAAGGTGASSNAATTVAGSGDLTGEVRVRTLTDDQRKLAFAAAELAAQETPGFSTDSMVVAGAVILAMVFAPVVIGTIGSRRRRPRRLTRDS